MLITIITYLYQVKLIAIGNKNKFLLKSIEIGEENKIKE